MTEQGQAEVEHTEAECKKADQAEKEQLEMRQEEPGQLESNLAKNKTSGIRSIWIRRLVLVLLGLLMGLQIYFVNAGRVMGDPLPMPFGYGAAVVLSGSMEPTYSAGDLLIVKKADHYQTGDIVVY